MINKLKTIAITTLVAGATALTTTAQAAVVNTNTYTNVIQNLTIALTAYSNAPVKSATLMSGEKPVTITTKTVLAALSNASAGIPTLVGFNWGRSPQLVMNTTFAASNSTSYTSNAVATNSAQLSTTNNPIIAFNTNTNSFPSGVELTVTDTNGTATLTNNANGTNVVTSTGTWNVSGGSNVTGTAFSLVGTNGLTNAVTGIPTNAGLWTVFTAVTNSAGTNVTAITYTNVPHSSNTYFTNFQGVQVEGGTAAAPTFADVGDYIDAFAGTRAIITATGTGFGTTNAVTNSVTANAIGGLDIDLFNTNASTAAGNNLELNLSGFFKVMSKFDVLHQVKGLTNQVGDETFTGSVAGSGRIGGSYLTNAFGGPNSSLLFATEGTGTNGSVTNAITGSITNAIPVVVQGTVSLGAPKNVAQ